MPFSCRSICKAPFNVLTSHKCNSCVCSDDVAGHNKSDTCMINCNVLLYFRQATADIPGWPIKNVPELCELDKGVI